MKTKIVCDYCKTEYTLPKQPSGSVKCFCCGHTWVPYKHFFEIKIMEFMFVICALLSALVFVGAVVYKTVEVKNQKKKTLYVSDVKVSVDKINDMFFVTGQIINQTDDIYGLPNVVVKVFDSEKNIVFEKNMIPPTTLLEAKRSVNFNYKISIPSVNAKTVKVELKDFE